MAFPPNTMNAGPGLGLPPGGEFSTDTQTQSLAPANPFDETKLLELFKTLKKESTDPPNMNNEPIVKAN